MIISLRPSKDAPTKDVPISRIDHLDNYKKNLKITNFIFEKENCTSEICSLHANKCLYTETIF